MSATFKGNFDRVEKAVKQAVNPTSVAFAKAANKYVKKDTGATEASVWSASKFDDGKVIWDTNYAGHAYYLGNALKDKNLQASNRWAEVAKSQDMDEVINVAKNAIKEAL